MVDGEDELVDNLISIVSPLDSEFVTLRLEENRSL